MYDCMDMNIRVFVIYEYRFLRFYNKYLLYDIIMN